MLQPEQRVLIPASPSIVEKFILEILSGGRPRSRAELIALARQMATANGFALPSPSAVATVKKALARLARQKLIITPRVGWWMLPGSDALHFAPNSERTIPLDANLPDPRPTDFPKPPIDSRLTIEREIGAGAQCVYLYYHKAHAELAKRNGASSWECKIGCTIGDPDARVIGQGALTAFPRPPVIGLLIRTDDGRSLERLLHAAMVYAKRRIDEGGGTEWFLTSPNQVEEWYKSFLGTVKFLRRSDTKE